MAKEDNPTWSEKQLDEYVKQEQNNKLLFNDEYLKTQHAKIVRTVDENFGILSLTTQKNNFLMWSHYTNSHQGICIGFDTAKLFEAASGVMGAVSYDETFPIKHLQEDVADFVKRLLFTKAKYWEYEDEYRLTKIGLAKKNVTLPSDTIVELIFGCKTQDSDKTDIISKIQKINPNCNIYETVLSKTNFELDINPIY